MSEYYIFLSIFAIGAITFGLRALPFLFIEKMENNDFFSYIGSNFPVAMMFILACYASGLPNASNIGEISHEMIAIVTTSLFHIRFRNYLLSILSGVGTYLLMIS